MTDIFVFGSNLAGRHGAGAALHARKHHGAEYGVGEGLTGTAYALPTVDRDIRTLPLDAIAAAILRFAAFARSRPDLTFNLTPIGCGLAGYTQAEVRPLVEAADMPPNVKLTEHWT